MKKLSTLKIAFHVSRVFIKAKFHYLLKMVQPCSAPCVCSVARLPLVRILLTVLTH